MKGLFRIILIFTLLSCEKDRMPDEIIENEVNPEFNIPEVKTYEAKDLNIYSVELGLKIISQGDTEIKEVGLVIGTSNQPTISENFYKSSLSPNDSGEYRTHMTSLPEEITIFFVRAYAINDNGIAYGNEIQFTTLGSKTYNGDVTLSTQEEVIEFGINGYNTINGDLKLHGSVNDLSPLKDLYIVNNSFKVSGTTSLENFKGLENLKLTGAKYANDFLILNNQSLINFEGLESLEVTRGEFYVLNNNKLRSLEGLNQFYAASSGGMRIEKCNNLNSLKGLEKLEFIGDGLSIVENLNLTDISALSNLKYVPRRIYVALNEKLKNINGLESIKNIDELLISNNDLLSNMDGIKDCESLNFLKIEGNNSLRQVPLFKNLTSIKSINISYGGSIIDLSGFQNLNSVGELIFFKSNILSLEGLENLEEIKFKLDITNSNNLRNLKGLNNLKYVGDGNYYSGITISENAALLSFDGLQNLNEIKGSFGIDSNNSLLNFDGLENLAKINQTMHLHGNDKLNNINSITNLKLLNGLVLENNPELTQLPNFINLTHLEYIFIAYGGGLKNLSGLSNLRTVGSISLKETTMYSFDGLTNLDNILNFLQIERCPNILDLKGLENVKNLGNNGSDGGLIISYNNNFDDFEGLSSLVEINGDLKIWGNNKLKKLSGLENILKIEKNIEIYENSTLSNFCALSSLIDNSFTGNYGVGGNLKNPTIQEIKDGNCN